MTCPGPRLRVPGGGSTWVQQRLNLVQGPLNQGQPGSSHINIGKRDFIVRKNLQQLGVAGGEKTSDEVQGRCNYVQGRSIYSEAGLKVGSTNVRYLEDKFIVVASVVKGMPPGWNLLPGQFKVGLVRVDDDQAEVVDGHSC